LASSTKLSAWSGKSVPISENASTNNGAITVQGVNYITIDGWIIRNSGKNGIQINDSNYITISNSTIHSNRDNGIFVNTSSSNITIFQNTINSNSDHGLVFYQSATVSSNIFYSNAGGGQIGAYDSSSSGDVTITNNIIHSASNIGIQLANVTSSTANSRNFSVINNTFYNTQNISLKISFYSDNGSYIVTNNIFSITSGQIFHFLDASVNKITSNYNNLYNSSAYIGQWGVNNYSTFSSWKAATSQDANSISSDPLFVSTTSGAEDFHLQTSSLTIDAGDPTSSYSNEPNGGSGRIDIGAYGNTSSATTRNSKTYYINTDGNDSNSGSESSPLKTISAALGKAKVSGDTIRVAKGTYSFDGVSLATSKLSLIGEDSAKTIIEGKSNAIINIEADEITISGFTLKGTAGTDSAIYINKAVNKLTVSNNIIQDKKYGIHMYNNLTEAVINGNTFTNLSTAAIYSPANTATLTIESNKIYGNENGIVTTGEISNLIIKNNTIYGNTSKGINLNSSKASTVKTSNNIIAGNGEGLAVSSLIASSITSSNNNFFNNTYHISGMNFGSKDFFDDLELINPPEDFTPRNEIYKTAGENNTVVGAVSTSSLNYYYVSSNGSDETGDGSQTKPFKTIKKAIDSAVSGSSRIRINPGKYIENLLINKNMILESTGVNTEDTVLEGSVDINDGADGTIIKRIYFKPRAGEYVLKAEGISKTIKNIKIVENQFDGESTFDNGIIFKNISGGEITKNVIRKFRKRGIKALKTTAAVRENIIQEIKNENNDAVAVDSAEGSTITTDKNGYEDNDAAFNIDSSSNGSSSNNDNRKNKNDYSGKSAKGQGDTSDKNNDVPKIRRIIFVDDNGSAKKKDFVNANKVRKLIIKTTDGLNKEVSTNATISLVSLSGIFFSDADGLNAVNSIALKDVGTTTFYYVNSSSTELDVVTASETPDQGWEDASLTMNILRPQTVSGVASTILNWPNPFNPDKESAKLQYDLSENKNTTVYIYDLTMNLLWKRDFAAGTEGGRSDKKNEISWDGKTDFADVCANGVYLIIVVDSSNKKILAKGKIAVLK
jgi:parallel beta-helix repeat protein